MRNKQIDLMRSKKRLFTELLDLHENCQELLEQARTDCKNHLLAMVRSSLTKFEIQIETFRDTARAEHRLITLKLLQTAKSKRLQSSRNASRA